jgi:hypothetical protein
MACNRQRLEDFLRIPVIDPTQAATGLARTAVLSLRAARLAANRAAA